MSSLATVLMVASGALCLAGALGARIRLGAVASSVMLIAMIDLAVTELVPPVLWSAALLIVGLSLAVSLRPSEEVPSSRRSPALVLSGAGGPAEVEIGNGGAGAGVGVGIDDRLGLSTAPDRRATRAGSLPWPKASVLSAIAYPVMAWQILNHGTHMSGSAHGGGHEHHAGDMSLISTFFTGGVVVLAVLLVVCAVHDIMRRRPLVSLDCWGMAAMIVVMQFVH